MTTRSLPDLCDAHADLVQVAEPLFRDFGARRAFHGPIRTIKCHEDNALARATLQTPGAGHVLVVDGGGSLRHALVGDKLGALMLENGWAGVVVYGAVRDVEVLATMPVAVRAVGVIPRPPQKKGLGELDVPVRFAGVTFTPGHWLYADENGLLVSATPLA
ncbi:MAG: ribonuclease E activity regulator RraA [Steroidobacteraceae bacterium]|jgi:regulator of ribonuclease activity A|nr:ribonuclease E activity regulator RraA [Steroidobacteraceae bacterium]